MKILKAAEAVLTEHGFYAFSMQSLAKQAEVSIGTIYRYFENKDALMNELQKLIRTESADQLFTGWDDNLPDKKKYDLVWQNAFNFVINNPKRMTLMEMLHYVPNMDHAEVTVFENETFKRLINFYQQGIDSKRFLNWQLFALMPISIETALNLAKQVIRGRVPPDQFQLNLVRDASWQAIQNPHFNQQD
ncbi:TetR/AcrR family transcriptional regulator [Psychromonas sp. KJ10-2]|uniref:TetR/AcrR family transcriptional regulator n=1 Tax=Psychromonas sp. KJ10-2 TaxID=3391822 RepID=UPI0039B4A55C